MNDNTIKIYDYVSHRTFAVKSGEVNVSKTKSTKGFSGIKVPGRKTVCEVHLKKNGQFRSTHSDRPVLFTSKQTFNMVTKLPRGKWV